MDLLCLDTKNKTYVVVENKVGYEYMECHTKNIRMEKPFDQWDDSIRNQHHLQLLGTTILFMETFGLTDYSKVTSVLIRFKAPHSGSDDISLDVEPLDEGIAKKKDEMIAVLLQAATPKKKKKEPSL